MRPVLVEEKVGTTKIQMKKAPRNPRRVANVKLYPLRQTAHVVNATNFPNFQLDPPIVLAP